MVPICRKKEDSVTVHDPGGSDHSYPKLETKIRVPANEKRLALFGSCFSIKDNYLCSIDFAPNNDLRDDWY